MPRTTTPQPFSDSFWYNSMKYFSTSTPFYTKRTEGENNLNNSLTDEAPEFYDPYSDIHLFLSQKVKQEWEIYPVPKVWSLEVQKRLLEKTAPDFRGRFPRYRLGVALLKEIWDKLSSCAELLAEKQGVFTQEGKLDIPFLIREYRNVYNSPYSLAAKLSEWIALVDGEKPDLEQLIQRILAPGSAQ